MFKQFATLFDKRREGDNKTLSAGQLQLAVAALLLEAARSDFAIDLVEEQHIAALLQERYQLDQDATEQLMRLANAEVEEAISLDQFTRILDRNLQPDEKTQLMQMLWEVAYVDGRIDKYEEYLLRRLSDLLHIPHSRFIRSKLAAERSLKESRKGC